jgi:hypothetical protein
MRITNPNVLTGLHSFILSGLNIRLKLVAGRP